MQRRREKRYPKLVHARDLYSRDERLLSQCLDMASEHDSGGSYSMVAIANKSKPIGVGYNTLLSPAHLKHEMYPEICGVHAELDLWTTYRSKLSNSTIVIAGIHTKNGNRVDNTLPCVYCAALLLSSGVRWIIAYHKGETTKALVADLVYHRNDRANRVA